MRPEEDIRVIKKYFLKNAVEYVQKEEPKKDNKPMFFYKSKGKNSKKESVEAKDN